MSLEIDTPVYAPSSDENAMVRLVHNVHFPFTETSMSRPQIAIDLRAAVGRSSNGCNQLSYSLYLFRMAMWTTRNLHLMAMGSYGFVFLNLCCMLCSSYHSDASNRLC